MCNSLNFFERKPLICSCSFKPWGGFFFLVGKTIRTHVRADTDPAMFSKPTSRPVILEHDADALDSMAFVYCSRKQANKPKKQQTQQSAG